MVPDDRTHWVSDWSLPQSSAPITGWRFISAYSSGVNRPFFKRIESGIAIFPTSCK